MALRPVGKSNIGYRNKEKEPKREERKSALGDAADMYFNINTLGGYGVAKNYFEQSKAARELEADIKANPARANEELDALNRAKEDFMKLQGEAVDRSKRLAGEGLPSEIRDRAQEDIQAGVAQATQTASDYGGALRAIGGVTQSANKSYRELLSLDASTRLQNEQNYLKMQEDYNKSLFEIDEKISGAAGEAEMINEVNPYLMKLQQLQQLRNAKQQSLQAGGQWATDMLGMGMNAATGGMI